MMNHWFQFSSESSSEAYGAVDLKPYLLSTNYVPGTMQSAEDPKRK